MDDEVRVNVVVMNFARYGILQAAAFAGFEIRPGEDGQIVERAVNTHPALAVEDDVHTAQAYQRQAQSTLGVQQSEADAIVNRAVDGAGFGVQGRYVIDAKIHDVAGLLGRWSHLNGWRPGF